MTYIHFDYTRGTSELGSWSDDTYTLTLTDDNGSTCSFAFDCADNAAAWAASGSTVYDAECADVDAEEIICGCEELDLTDDARADLKADLVEWLLANVKIKEEA